MEIVNPLDREHRDIKTPLLRMATSDDPLQALRGRLLLDLARHLEAHEGPRTIGNVVLGELLLCAGSRQCGPVVRVAVDWLDYGPVQDGLPLAHYRVRVQRPNMVLSEETRTPEAENVVRIILHTLGESTGNG